MKKLLIAVALTSFAGLSFASTVASEPVHATKQSASSPKHKHKHHKKHTKKQASKPVSAKKSASAAM